MIVLHPQLVELCGCTVGLVCISPGLNELFLEVFVDRFVWSRRSGNGQNPVLHASFPFADIWAIHIGEGMGDLLPRVHHDRMCGVHELVKAKLVKETIGFLSVSIEDKGFFPLKWFSILSHWIWVLWELR